MNTIAKEKVWLASLHLDGIANEWYYALERDHEVLPSARFVDYINMCFKPPIHTKNLVEMKALYRTETVEENQQ